MILLKNIYKSYGEENVLKGLNLEIRENKITCIIGKSGIGKTTLLSILANIEQIDSGEIINNNHKISFVFQRDTLLPNTKVIDNFKYILGEIYDKEKLGTLIDKYLEKFEMAEKKYEYKENLSGGMVQRIKIIQALLYPSDILILDEPFKELDEEMKEILVTELKKINKTIIISSHDLDLVKNIADDIVELK
ncbi:MAG TPA: ABC transporter [Clostridiales bacterium]|nr:MAG: hypothetical protein A2Y18_02710 [Clostridiales bacterium GWD2_32_19]HCC07621.1 ABC transporter [Clostridiales bacterium]